MVPLRLRRLRRHRPAGRPAAGRLVHHRRPRPHGGRARRLRLPLAARGPRGRPPPALTARDGRATFRSHPLRSADSQKSRVPCRGPPPPRAGPEPDGGPSCVARPPPAAASPPQRSPWPSASRWPPAPATPRDDPSPSASSTSTANAADAAALAKVKVEGEPGSKPTITLPSTPFDVTRPHGRAWSTRATATTIEDGQTLSIQTIVGLRRRRQRRWATRTRRTPETIVADENLLPELHDALVGQKVGVRILSRGPAAAADGPRTNVVVGEVVDAKDTPTARRARG